jgi:hypothetical protein
MTNRKFQSLLIRTHKAKEKYFALIAEAEAEYKRRFGYYPSEVDDDHWIDRMHYPQGSCPTVYEVTAHAKDREVNQFGKSY